MDVLPRCAASLGPQVAEDVKRATHEAPTRKLKPSQTCPACGAVTKKLLAQRWHCCHACGHDEGWDSAAARVELRWALGTLDCGQELPETA